MATYQCRRHATSGMLICNGRPAVGDTLEVDWNEPDCEFEFQVREVLGPVVVGTVQNPDGAACQALGFTEGAEKTLNVAP